MASKEPLLDEMTQLHAALFLPLTASFLSGRLVGSKLAERSPKLKAKADNLGSRFVPNHSFIHYSRFDTIFFISDLQFTSFSYYYFLTISKFFDRTIKMILVFTSFERMNRNDKLWFYSICHFL